MCERFKGLSCWVWIIARWHRFIEYHLYCPVRRGFDKIVNRRLYQRKENLPVHNCPLPYRSPLILVLWWSCVCVRVAVHLGDPLFNSQTLIIPIVSPVYRTAKLSEIALPSKHSTGLVCEEMAPRFFNDSDLARFERSLNHPSYWDLALQFFICRQRTRTVQFCLNLLIPKFWDLGKRTEFWQSHHGHPVLKISVH